MDKVAEELETKKTSRFQSFIYVVLIPLLFTITVALIVMTILGYNVFELTKEYGQKIPFVSSMISDDASDSAKDIVKTYETISAKKAAPILSQMSETEALQILTNLKSDRLAEIMEKMEPEDAARYTELLTADVEESE